MPPLFVRLKHAHAVLTGRIILPCSFEDAIFMTYVAKTVAMISGVSASADAVIASHSQDATDLAAAKAKLASIDDDLSSQLSAVKDKLDAALPVAPPAPVVDPTVVDPAAVDPNAPVVDPTAVDPSAPVDPNALPA